MLNAFMAKRKNLSAADDSGRWIYGFHAVLAALANPRRRCRRVVVAAHDGQAIEARLAEAAADSGVDRPGPEVVGRRDVERLLPAGAVHQGVALLADDLPETTLEAFHGEAGDRPAVILDQVSDPRNVGAVLRSAAAFGAGAVIVHGRRSPPATGVLTKAASGGLEKVPLIRVPNIARALDTLKEAGFWCVGLDPGAPTTIAGAGLSGRVGLVLGSEGGGLRRLTRRSCDLLVRVPTTGAVGSLNLSATAAIALYELNRRG